MKIRRRLMQLVVLQLVACPFISNAAADPPADYRSRNFLIHTDIPAEDAEQLLGKLESMLAVISRYWAAPSRKTIECYVVDDARNWSTAALSAQARNAVQNGGLTVAQGVQRGRALSMTAKVFASSKFGTAQHEAVHAYCWQTFGRTGPTWYAEGMAELGNYWKDGDPTVTAPEYVIQFLKRSKRKSLKEITSNQQFTGDGWRNYAWRWALCHFLVNNPNYRDRFRVLGAKLLSGQSGSFQRTFNSQMDELNFEFQRFVNHLNSGYNVEACVWNWKARFREPISGKPIVSRIFANRGWQASGLLVKKGQRYSIGCNGSWKTSPSEEISADGNGNGAGRLVGAIYQDFKLGPNIKLGETVSFLAAKDGQLMLRCQDQWHDLQNNSSYIEVQLTAADKGP